MSSFRALSFFKSLETESVGFIIINSGTIVRCWRIHQSQVTVQHRSPVSRQRVVGPNSNENPCNQKGLQLMLELRELHTYRRIKNCSNFLVRSFLLLCSRNYKIPNSSRKVGRALLLKKERT